MRDVELVGERIDYRPQGTPRSRRGIAAVRVARSLLTALALVFAISSSVMAYGVPNAPYPAAFTPTQRTTCQTYTYPDGHRGWWVHEPLGGPMFKWSNAVAPYMSVTRLVVVEASADGLAWTPIDTAVQTTAVTAAGFGIGATPYAQFPGFSRPYTVTANVAMRVREMFFFYTTNPPSGTAWKTGWAFHDNYQTLLRNQYATSIDYTTSDHCVLIH